MEFWKNHSFHKYLKQHNGFNTFQNIINSIFCKKKKKSRLSENKRLRWKTLKYLTEPKLLMGRIKNNYKMYTYFYVHNLIYIINWNIILTRHWHHGFFEENVDLMDLHWDIYCTFYSVWHLRPACQSRSSWPQWWVWDLEADG